MLTDKFKFVVVLLGGLLVACAPTPTGTTKFQSKTPETAVLMTHSDINTLDPAWNYELVGGGIIEDIYDTLITYVGPDATRFAPALATNWEIKDGGKTYVFTIREGVKFHEGQDLTPEDVEYTFERGLLQGGTWSPQWLYTEAFFGTGVYDVAELVDPEGNLDDDPEALQAADPARLMAACKQVTDAIRVDGNQVTFHLSQPWNPLLATLAGFWGSIVDKEWTIAQGAWDGDCATWQNYYGVTSETTPLRDITNGTGPYKLDHWTPGEELVLVANEAYWREEPAWESGPSGPPRIKRVIIKMVEEWGTRSSAFKIGDADYCTVPQENVVQMDPLVGEMCNYVDVGEWDCQLTENPDAPLRLYKDFPLTSRDDVFFVFDINVEGGNPYVGSGQLDGNGIPPDFFGDIHVRRAFNYCFDWSAFIDDVLGGEGVQNYGPINAGLIGYDPNAPHYTYDQDRCIEELKLAQDGQVWENGFRFQIVYNSGNQTRQSVAEILQASFADIDPRFQIEILGLPWAAFLKEVSNSRIPIFVGNWVEDIHDPHNWAQPFLVGTYARRQRIPESMSEEFKKLVSSGVAAATSEERAEIYGQIQVLDYEYALGIRLAVPTGRHYEQRWMKDWYYNPMVNVPWYAFAKE